MAQGGGAWAIWGGVLHVSGASHQLATSIGYAPSMFQWEVDENRSGLVGTRSTSQGRGGSPRWVPEIAPATRMLSHVAQ